MNENKRGNENWANFYNASYLVSKGFIPERIEKDEDNTYRYVFQRSEALYSCLKTKKKNKELEDFISAMNLLKKMKARADKDETGGVLK